MFSQGFGQDRGYICVDALFWPSSAEIKDLSVLVGSYNLTDWQTDFVPVKGVLQHSTFIKEGLYLFFQEFLQFYKRWYVYFIRFMYVTQIIII